MQVRYRELLVVRSKFPSDKCTSVFSLLESSGDGEPEESNFCWFLGWKEKLVSVIQGDKTVSFCHRTKPLFPTTKTLFLLHFNEILYFAFLLSFNPLHSCALKREQWEMWMAVGLRDVLFLNPHYFSVGFQKSLLYFNLVCQSIITMNAVRN